MPYGRSLATLEETDDGTLLTVKIKLPHEGEPSKSGHATNLTDPNKWIDVVDERGLLTPIRVAVAACIPHRKAEELRRRGAYTSTAPRLVRRSLM